MAHLLNKHEKYRKIPHHRRFNESHMIEICRVIKINIINHKLSLETSDEYFKYINFLIRRLNHSRFSYLKKKNERPRYPIGNHF